MSLQDYLPTTPENATPAQIAAVQQYYMPPEQIAQMRQYSDALTKGGQRDQPITSPWQGVRMMADALSGNIMRGRAGQAQAQNTFGMGQQVASIPPSGGVPSQPSPPQAGGLDPQTARTFKLESDNNPNAVTGSNVGLGQFGPEEMRKYGITNPTDPTQQISAMHKETAENAQGLAKALGRQPTPGEIYLAHQQGLAGATALLTNPNAPAWQAVRKFYPSDAIAQKAIAGNPPGGGHFDPNAPAGAFTGAWVKQFESRLPQSPTNGQTADASGHIGGTSPPQIGSPQVMAQALAAKGGGPVPGPAPVAAEGNPTMGAQYAPSRPHITQGQMGGILGNQWVPPEIRNSLYGQYMQQNQPVEAAGPGGRWVIPSGGGKPLWVPELQKGNLKAGDVEAPYAGTFGEPGASGQQFNPIQGMPGAGGPFQGQTPDFSGLPPIHPPAAPPTAAPPGPQGAITPSGPSTASGSPTTMQASPMGQLAAAGAARAPPMAPPSGAPTALAVPGNIKSDAGGMLGVPPPSAATAPSSQAAEPQVAQAAGGLPSLNDLANFSLGMKKQGELNTEDVKKYTENSNGLLLSGNQATQGLPMIGIAKKMVQDPRFYSGVASDQVLAFKQLQSALGNDPNKSAPMEIFDKSMAGDILNQLKSKLQGLGQVRNAEINLVNRATANLHMTPAANMAVLNIIEKSYNQVSKIAEITKGYMAGARLDKDGNYVPARPGDQPSNAGLESMIHEYLKNNPTFSPEEIKDYNHTLDIEPKAPTATTQRTGHPQPMATPAAGFNQSAPPPPPGFR